MSDNKTVNTMIELTKTNRITVGVLLVLVILLFGFLFMKPAEYTFNTSLDKELADLNDSKLLMSPQALAQAMLKKDASIVVVDVRSPFEFAKSHLPEAQNFYEVNLFDKASINFFKNLKNSGKTAVLYGSNVSQANIPFMMLKQMGVENIKLMTTGFTDLNSTNWSEISKNTTQFNDEKSVADFAQFIKDAKKTAPTSESVPNENKPDQTAKPKVVVKPTASGGGDEGC
jgi:rhodanese-related sulfurtransferase